MINDKEANDETHTVDDQTRDREQTLGCRELHSPVDSVIIPLLPLPPCLVGWSIDTVSGKH